MESDNKNSGLTYPLGIDTNSHDLLGLTNDFNNMKIDQKDEIFGCLNSLLYLLTKVWELTQKEYESINLKETVLPVSVMDEFINHFRNLHQIPNKLHVTLHLHFDYYNSIIQ